MFKKVKWLILILLLFFPIHAIANALTEGEVDTEVSEIEEKRTNQMLRYQSNQYTQPEVDGAESEGNTLIDSYQLIAENDSLALYVEEDSLALQIENKKTGFIWMSGLDMDQEYNLNNTWTNMAHSAVTIDYINDDGKESTESILTNQSEITMEQLDNGFKAEISFEEAGIAVPLEVRLDGGSINVSVRQEGIREEDNRLATMRVYPFLGAVESVEESNGYLFIPDGSGALMRFSERHLASSSPFQATVYGEDQGFTRSRNNEEDNRIVPPQQVTLPVYGLVDTVNKDAYFTVIEEGKNFAEILAYPSGISTDFHWIATEYHYRYQYFQPTSQKMDGYNVYQEEINQFDIQEKITFLSDEKADYVGMAQTYKQYLKDNNMLLSKGDEVDTRLEFLGGEVKSGLIWDSVVPMTKIQELPQYVERLRAQEVNDFHLVYRGWSDGGLTGTLPNKFPFESVLGDKNDFEEVNQLFQKNNIPFYYYTDYTKAFNNAKGFSGSTDIARKINAEPIITTKKTNYYHLSPKKSLEIMEKDKENYQKHHINHLAVDTTANTLFSDFNSDMMRSDAISFYQDMFEELSENMKSLSFYQPNDYMLALTDRYLDIPMYTSNYQFVTDTVPFLQIVLKGDIPYYASFSNFHYNPEDELLRMIEYGAYPSFYLTSEPSHELMHTPSNDLYTSQFDDWEDTIVEQYKVMKETLGKVEGETIKDRIVHETGVVEVKYSNGISIYVNYTNRKKDIDGISIEEKGYNVVDRRNQS
ncbi:DUF5696 domain-containing protein [Gracilibacillus sp. YIM 98692]|uniref:DUF5696 domain-containing protein n=1 Tax=Gracilibacillus sp. YIM 98692 TaxID=2663532 RepID=UPI0013D25948|nr:DUF5696 domain-containing protein [Gracilibacillus sp. YIM 98692]